MQAINLFTLMLFVLMLQNIPPDVSDVALQLLVEKLLDCDAGNLTLSPDRTKALVQVSNVKQGKHVYRASSQ